MTAPLISRDEVDAWREAHPEAALAEAVSVVIGMVLQHTADETKRAAAINVLIEAHRRALAGFTPARRLH
jgi:hypothetical protein